MAASGFFQNLPRLGNIRTPSPVLRESIVRNAYTFSATAALITFVQTLSHRLTLFQASPGKNGSVPKRALICEFTKYTRLPLSGEFPRLW
jgi:hypothetical protein